MIRALAAATVEDVVGTATMARTAPSHGLFVAPQPLANDISEELENLQWKRYTTVPLKQHYYGKETYFRESYDDARRVFGSELDRVLHRYTAIVFKPDAIVARKIRDALDFLGKNGFRPVLAKRLRYTDLAMREDWRYQLNQLTLDRMRLNTILAGMSDALMVFLEDQTDLLVSPASVRLQSLKGPSFPDKQRPEHLRFVLKSWSRLLKYVHTPDEPADLVRELGILFPFTQRRHLLQVLKGIFSGGGAGRVDEIIAELYAETPAHDLSLGNSTERLLSLKPLAARPGSNTSKQRDRLAATIEACWSGATLDWRALEAELDSLGSTPGWDHIVLAAAYIQHSFPGEPPLISSDGLKGWLAGEGEIVS